MKVLDNYSDGSQKVELDDGRTVILSSPYSDGRRKIYSEDSKEIGWLTAQYTNGSKKAVLTDGSEYSISDRNTLLHGNREFWQKIKQGEQLSEADKEELRSFLDVESGLDQSLRDQLLGLANDPQQSQVNEDDAESLDIHSLSPDYSQLIEIPREWIVRSGDTPRIRELKNELRKTYRDVLRLNEASSRATSRRKSDSLIRKWSEANDYFCLVLGWYEEEISARLVIDPLLILGPASYVFKDSFDDEETRNQKQLIKRLISEIKTDLDWLRDWKWGMERDSYHNGKVAIERAEKNKARRKELKNAILVFEIRIHDLKQKEEINRVISEIWEAANLANCEDTLVKYYVAHPEEFELLELQLSNVSIFGNKISVSGTPEQGRIAGKALLKMIKLGNLEEFLPREGRQKGLRAFEIFQTLQIVMGFINI
ncbi:MAG: hypothetical protein UW23_C0029G0017 [Candidatus Collierbacteria bacterium GW2011_GWA1_44_12]|uniref:Uncharacterized protein n=1 Tax=Candidatus Collierbacteria bacterium GW2011_GWA1_44_12 TaxID=1618376 RepID=A0A0G1JHD4_9BACT|nr:MAG: hypothetical protein UW23_C0029G0017 [Candidatus Collierbacteria bacterium GW2011_GWA1_44_12]